MKRPYSYTFHKVKKMLDDPETKCSDLTAVIARDPDFSEWLTGILRYCEIPASVWGTDSAVRLLGIEGIRHIVTKPATPQLNHLKKPES